MSDWLYIIWHVRWTIVIVAVGLMIFAWLCSAPTRKD